MVGLLITTGSIAKEYRLLITAGPVVQGRVGYGVAPLPPPPAPHPHPPIKLFLTDRAGNISENLNSTLFASIIFQVFAGF
jgi:hypothetical protein